MSEGNRCGLASEVSGSSEPLPVARALSSRSAEMLVRELVLSYRETVGPQCPGSGRRLSRPQDALSVLRSILEQESVETFGILCLSTRRSVLGYHAVSRGDLSSTVVHPREVFKVALLANAAAIVVGHNHPSGDPEPSQEDTALTRRLEDAGDLVGVPLLDHIIIGHNERYYSYRAAGMLRGGVSL